MSVWTSPIEWCSVDTTWFIYVIHTWYFYCKNAKARIQFIKQTLTNTHTPITKYNLVKISIHIIKKLQQHSFKECTVLSEMRTSCSHCPHIFRIQPRPVDLPPTSCGVQKLVKSMNHFSCFRWYLTLLLCNVTYQWGLPLIPLRMASNRFYKKLESML